MVGVLGLVDWTSIPSSRTGIMQAARWPGHRPPPRGRKEASIMQYGPPGAPDTGVVRVVAIPAASNATPTLSS
jgi:hypothetical protein